ncbi:YIP1 family protein [Granulicella arctica]|uniref:YIP1 family protein n=1 Tax=Granulicella arctica TaxID=940613 RepID=UPI0021E05CFA|nr:YIP1 family protein [Granulicella arctica]
MMSGDTTIDSVTGTTTGLSQLERVVDAFIAPSKTFTDILRSTAWWLPFLLSVLMTVLGAFVIDKQVGYDTVVQNSLHDSPKQEQALAETEPKQRAVQLRLMTMSYRYTAYASPIFIILIAAVSALALWGSFNFGFGAQTTYGQMLAVWMYASLPRLLSSILMIATLYGGNAEAFNLKNPVGTNLGFYLPDAAPWVKVLLSFVDVIGLWSLALLVIGTAIVAKVSRGKAAVVVVGWWVLILIVSVGVAVATS